MSNDDQPLEPPWTILKILQWTTGFFKKNGIENPRPDAEILLAHTLGCERIDLYLRHDQPLHDDELKRFKILIQRRTRREPVAYIIGTKEFWSLEFKVTPDVLIPRPETEGLVESALRLCANMDSVRVLELGTGSGIISIALAHERPDWRFVVTDLSHESIRIARYNARKHRVADRMSFLVGHWFGALGTPGDCFDLIISNPPYIPKADMASLEPEIHQYEPVRALDGGMDGMDAIAEIVESAPHYMRRDGTLLLEIGYDQGVAVEALGRNHAGYDRVVVRKDYSGHDRVAQMRLARK